jgi:hypothetical protein
MNASLFGDGFGGSPKFHEKGKLESAKLTKDLGK